ncbi:unnamed protein product [Blepharisma stoltei]|uniref:Uncharacterized protein n=1 Tax=Blepharisma stoltei TaxID=1481888 RepID=A0AAU9K3C3_9CILI|nr:unnamed protein product [Blepharisma stoltei]
MSDREEEEILDENPKEEQEEEYYEDMQEGEHLAPDHPLMRNLQGALKSQLSAELERLNLQLREKEETLKKFRRDREDVGVQLYGVQQQLAKMQMNYERTRDNYNIIKKYREESDEQLDVLQNDWDKKKKEVEDQAKKVNKAQDELNQINRTLRQVEEYNEQMKSEIAQGRRMTYKAEEAVVRLEKEKKGQDVLIDHMNEEIKRLGEQKNLLEAQLRSQREQTETATETLKDANEQLDKINLSKKDLMADWRDYLRGMQRRDETLQAIQSEIQKQREQESNLDSELRGYQQLFKQETENYDKLLQQMDSTKNELGLLKKNLENFENQKKYLEEQDRMLKASKKATEKEISNLETKKKGTEDQLGVIEKNIMKLHQETQKLMEDIINNLSEQTTIEKSANNLSKQTDRIKQGIREKEAEKEDVNNDIIRVKMDVLHTEQGLGMLREKKDEIEKELAEKDELLKRFEKNIRNNHDDLEKKQLRVDKLNREYANLTKDITDESSGPYEAKLNHLERSILEKDTEISRLERDWIYSQTRLVEKQNEIQQIEINNSDYKTKLIILEQRKLRLNNHIESSQKERDQVENSLKSLRNYMNRINILLDKNRESYRSIEDDNRHLEKDFVDRLKELERETAGIEKVIEQLKKEKEDVLSDIVEAERQILLWERKIQLEKEMQMTIDPNVGQKEMEDMKKEIHRMELKLESLRKRQEQLIKDMERAVSKRETIQLKYQPRVEKNKKSGASIGKQVANLKNTLKHTTQNSQQIDASIKQREDELQQLAQELENAAEFQSNVEEDVQRNSVEVCSMKLEKNKNLWLITKFQTAAKRHEEAASGNFKLSGRPDALEQQLESEETKYATISVVLQQIASENPQFQILFDKILNWD